MSYTYLAYHFLFSLSGMKGLGNLKDSKDVSEQFFTDNLSTAVFVLDTLISEYPESVH